jgi:hypothetical protein
MIATTTWTHTDDDGHVEHFTVDQSWVKKALTAMWARVDWDGGLWTDQGNGSWEWISGPLARARAAATTA